MDDQQIEFLNDQVKRLTIQLAKYRNQELKDEEETPLDQPGPPAPWLTDKSVLSPLIEEYDQQIQQLEEERDILKDELAR